MNQDDVNRALELFELSEPLTQEALEARCRALLATWHPHRYANLTNNPRKYMQMYRKGEAMSKEINAAYDLLRTWLAAKDAPASGASGGTPMTPRG